MTTNNYLVLARDQEQQKFWKILAGAVGGSLLLHAIAAVIFNLLPQPALDNSVEVTLVDSSELPPDFPSSPTPSVKVSLTSTPSPSLMVTPTPTPSVKITPTPTVKIMPIPTPTPSVKITPTPIPTPSVKITPTKTPAPLVKITPTPTPAPSVKITPIPTPTPSVKIKLDRTPVPVKIINRPSKSQPLPIQQTTELFSKPSLGIIATNPSPADQPDGSKVEGKIPGSQTIVDNQTPGTTIQPSKSVVERPIASPIASEIGPNSNLGSSSQANLSQQNQSGLTNPNLAGSLFEAGGGENSEPSISIITAPDGGLDDFLASGGGTNPNNQLPNGTTLSPRKPSLPGKPGEASGTIPGNNSPSGLNSQLLPSAGNSNSSDTGKKPDIASPSSPAGSAVESGGTSKQEIQKYFGELACLKNCKPVYPGAIVESRQVKINITLSAQGRVIRTSIVESCDHPRFDNYAEARFKEMLFQLPTGDQRDFIVTMEFKSK